MGPPAPSPYLALGADVLGTLELALEGHALDLERAAATAAMGAAFLRVAARERRELELVREALGQLGAEGDG